MKVCAYTYAATTLRRVALLRSLSIVLMPLLLLGVMVFSC